MDHSPVELPIDGVLDLHTFRPKDAKEVLNDYLALCLERGILEVRVIHGKGIGQMRNTVHALLARDKRVLAFALASEPYGGSGATIVRLKAPPESPPAAGDTPPASACPPDKAP